MKTLDLFKSRKVVLSAEVFPPKKTGAMEGVIRALKEIKNLNPDFVSITYSAGGGGGETTGDVASVAIDAFEMNTVAHITAVNMTKDKARETLDVLTKKGVENVLALRGDVTETSKFYDFIHASDLVQLIKAEYPGFNVIGACYPEGHIESPDFATDICNLKKKVDAGCSELITQLFFDNKKFFTFMDKLVLADIDVPIHAGIMPIVNANQVKRMLTLSGATVPHNFTKILGKYENDPVSLYNAGLDYAVNQISELIDNGVKGIHLYTMNNGDVARRIFNAVREKING